jgi:hypothetical protein
MILAGTPGRPLDVVLSDQLTRQARLLGAPQSAADATPVGDPDTDPGLTGDITPAAADAIGAWVEDTL